jgi:hypothetical protein
MLDPASAGTLISPYAENRRGNAEMSWRQSCTSTDLPAYQALLTVPFGRNIIMNIPTQSSRQEFILDVWKMKRNHDSALLQCRSTHKHHNATITTLNFNNADKQRNMHFWDSYFPIFSFDTHIPCPTNLVDTGSKINHHGLHRRPWRACTLRRQPQQD